jgi:hypothetical protein
MPRSKHRRKGKTRSRAAAPDGAGSDGSADLFVDDATAGDPADDDADMAEALALAEEELAAELAAADDDLDLDDEERDDAVAPLLQAVEEQVRLNEPPAVAATLARLVAEGHARDEAIRLIGAVLMLELNEVMQTNRDFDPALYAARLAALPNLPGLA